MTDIVLISPIYKTRTKNHDMVFITHCYPKEQIWIGIAAKGRPAVWGLFGNYNGEDTVGEGATGMDLIAVPEDVPGMTPPYEPKAMDVCSDEDGEAVLLLKPNKLYGGLGWRVLLKGSTKWAYTSTNRLAKNLSPWPENTSHGFEEILEGVQASSEGKTNV